MKNTKLIVYENEWVIRRIYEVSDRIRHQLTNQTLFEERCIKRIARYLTQSVSNKNNRRYVDRLINEVASATISRNKNESAELFTDLITVDEEEEEIEFDPLDVLADVESEVLAKEMVALLAEDDRKRIILEAWSNGKTDGRAIANTLASVLGGNSESHRKYVRRFEIQCQRRLSEAV